MSEFNPKTANRNKYRDSKSKKDKARFKGKPVSEQSERERIPKWRQNDRRQGQFDGEDSDSDDAVPNYHGAATNSRKAVFSRNMDDSYTNTFTIHPDTSAVAMNGGGKDSPKENVSVKNKRDREKQNKEDLGNRSPSVSNSLPTGGPNTTRSDGVGNKPGAVSQQPVPATVPANLKKETEDIKNLTQKYCKRKIVSTWSKNVELPKYDDYEDEGGADYGDLSTSSFSIAGHFLMKEEQEWFKQAESCGSPFSLDLKCLAAGLACIPFHKRQAVTETVFGPKEVQTMITEAESHVAAYMDIRNGVEIEVNFLPDNNSKRKTVDDGGNRLIELNKDFLLNCSVADNGLGKSIVGEEILLSSSAINVSNKSDSKSRIILENYVIDVELSPKDVVTIGGSECDIELVDDGENGSISVEVGVGDVVQNENCKEVGQNVLETKSYVETEDESVWAPEPAAGLERRNRVRGRERSAIGESVSEPTPMECRADRDRNDEELLGRIDNSKCNEPENNEGAQIEKQVDISGDMLASILQDSPSNPSLETEKQLDVREDRKATVALSFGENKNNTRSETKSVKKPPIIDDDDLNFLLGLTDSSSTANSSRSNTKDKNASPKKQTKLPALSALNLKSPLKDSDENLDDWLDSVLEN